MKIKFTQEHNIPDSRIQDLLCCALEGGSNYWYIITKFGYPDGKTSKDYEFPHLELPFKGGYLMIGDREDGQIIPRKLDINSIEKGLRLMADKYEYHFAEFIEENEDAVTGDVFLQLCLFGELVYA